MLIRPATEADMGDVVRLYNALIETTTITWTEVEQRLEDRLTWFQAQTERGFPCFVAETGAAPETHIVGFAAYGDFRGAGKWPGYRFTVEHTIHVQQDCWGGGVGRALIDALIKHAADAGMHVMVGGIDGANQASIDFHSRLGFVEVGRLPNIGFKNNEWLTLVLMQKELT